MSHWSAVLCLLRIQFARKIVAARIGSVTIGGAIVGVEVVARIAILRCVLVAVVTIGIMTAPCRIPSAEANDDRCADDGLAVGECYAARRS